ncbi:MAG: hypothetical protein JEY71_11115 [Sphaerochaeta sp.]|nr:hypothetical protein [Sphaerochaeta sp.]
MRKLRYPLEYGYSEKVQAVRVEARFYAKKGELPLVLDFHEKRSLVVRIGWREALGSEGRLQVL